MAQTGEEAKRRRGIALTGVDKEKVTSNSKLLILSDFEHEIMERVMGVEPTTFTLAT